MTAHHAFVCAECRQVIHDPLQQFCERMEYRRVDAAERRLTFTVRDLCRDCVDEIGQRLRNPSRAVQEHMTF